MQIIHKSPMPEVHIPDVSITTHVLRRAEEIPNRLAISDAANTSYTFSELQTAIKSMAGGLAARGFGDGQVLALMAPNMPNFAVAFHAAAVAGGTITTINPTYGVGEVHHQLKDSNATILLTISTFLEVALEASRGTAVEEVFVIDDPPNPANSANRANPADSANTVNSAETSELAETADLSIPDGVKAMAALMGDPIEEPKIDYADHVVVLPYSSGTTGLPKGVMLTHRNLVANVCQMKHVFQYGEDEVGLAALPFFHIYGMQVMMNGLLANGVTSVTMPRFDLATALQLVESHKITRFYAVPPMVLALAKSPLVDDYDLSSLKQIFSGAAPLGAKLADEAATRIGCEIVQGYGMTELSPVTHATPQGQYRPGTSGPAVSNTQCRIIDPNTGEDQDIGGRGELWIKGPMVMKGYLNNPEATAETIDADGWLHTGDVAELDEALHFTMVDRIKELIKYKGFQVPPAEIEAVLITHPAIVDVAVVGVADDEAGEIPKAFVVCAQGKTVTLTEAQELVSAHLASYKQIRALEVIDTIPKSASGKILRREIARDFIHNKP